MEGAARELGPIRAEATPLPMQNCSGGHDHESLPPPGPDFGQPDQEEAIGSAQWRADPRSFVDSELLAQGEVLESELPMAAEEEGQEPKQVE